MADRKNHKFSKKHGPDARPDTAVSAAIRDRRKESGLPCAVAFVIADERGISPGEVGKTADLLGCRLIQCQLGLFGYTPEKKIVKPKHPQEPGLEAAVAEAAAGGRLSCRKAWDIARRFGVRKMTVSGACEALGLKIKPCQLGAF